MATNQPYTVYILACANNSYYTGVTNDIERRLWEYETGHHPKCYTFHKRPVKLVFQEHFGDINQAIAFEKQIKGWRRAKKEALINDEWEKLPELSKKYSKDK
ncbi:MAG: GIY-YIG nuclease family protein [Reichenbachiella sp.]|uniref:GIY-YIG nuclease family protein n=1 Tax=Reichenbachiella sp. TaxID=2184521 RepID=UPI0029674119|nr:GIY-YIG nuclease family protein [Reichenbachiella sp.]MDW3209902.1 GIY-YIG nuclease family protein [Reichenbachiella sp.]